MSEDRSAARIDQIKERLAMCEDDIRDRPFSHPVTEAWYYEDVSWLLRQPRLVPHTDEAPVAPRGNDAIGA